jgi:hypothetical protein
LAILRLHLEVMALLLWALKNAPMREGQNSIDPSVREAMAASLRHQISHFPAEVVAQTIERFPFLHGSAAFTFRREHLLLLQLRFGWPGSRGVLSGIQRRGWLPVVAVNFKRPWRFDGLRA